MNPLRPTDDNTLPSISHETQAMMECLREAVSEALDRKRRLGQYYAQWTPEGIQLIGPDAPRANSNVPD